MDPNAALGATAGGTLPAGRGFLWNRQVTRENPALRPAGAGPPFPNSFGFTKD